MSGDSLPAAAFGFLEQRDGADNLSLFSEGRDLESPHMGWREPISRPRPGGRQRVGDET